MRNLALVLLLTAPLLAQSSSYKVTHTYPLGGEGTWDYIVPDPPNHRLFIARQNRVMVVDEDSGKLLGEVTGIQGAHGTAIAERRPWIRHLGQRPVRGHVRSEDLQGARPDSGRRRRGRDPLRRASNRVFTFNGDAHSSTVIDPQAGKLITNIPLGGKPEYGVSAGDGKVYANLTDTSEVVEIDAKTATVARRWSTAPCKQPVAMAIDVAAPPAVQRMPQRRDGGFRLSGRQGGGDGRRSVAEWTAPATMLRRGMRSPPTRTAP